MLILISPLATISGLLAHSLAFFGCFLFLPHPSPLGDTEEEAFLAPRLDIKDNREEWFDAYIHNCQDWDSCVRLFVVWRWRRLSQHPGQRNSKVHEWTLCSNQVLSLLGGFYKAKSAEAFALMKLVQVKRGFCNKMWTSEWILNIKVTHDFSLHERVLESLAGSPCLPQLGFAGSSCFFRCWWTSSWLMINMRMVMVMMIVIKST